LLDSLSAESRATMWATVLSASANWNSTQVHLAETAGEIVGLGACGSQRDSALRERGFVGEIGAIYVLRSQQGAGVGRSLMRLMAHDLAARAMPSASLWVLRENVRARGFFKRTGGAIVAEKVDIERNSTLHEVAYGWLDVAQLI
jgi:ribosomal protein S18 acetylase RimI-like enzyme